MRFSLAFEENEISLPNELRTEKNPTTRCGAEFTANHLQKCRPIKEQCRSCRGTNHFARICKRVKNVSFRGSGKNINRGGVRRVILNDQTINRSEDSTEEEAENMVLHAGGRKRITANRHLCWKKRNNVTFTAIIDAVSAITKLKQSDLRNLLETETLFLKPISKKEGIRRLQLATTTFIGLYNGRRPSGKENKKTSASRDNTRWQEFTYRTRLADKLERQVSQCKHE